MLSSLFSSSMILLVGLGNPGAEYKGNRHNIGFMAIDRVAQDYNFPAFKNKFHGQVSQHRINNQKIVLLKPDTYMNNSGQSVQAAAKFYNINPENIFVFYDEIDLPLAKIKVKQGGGAGGHNGIRSIDSHLKNKEYWRVRMGVDHPGDKARVKNYVLSDFAKQEQSKLEDMLYYTSKYTPLLIEGNVADFMTRTAEALK